MGCMAALEAERFLAAEVGRRRERAGGCGRRGLTDDVRRPLPRPSGRRKPAMRPAASGSVHADRRVLVLPGHDEGLAAIGDQRQHLAGRGVDGVELVQPVVWARISSGRSAVFTSRT